MTRAPYRRPEIVTDDIGRKHLTKATWNHDTMAIYIMEHGTHGWVAVGDLARLVWGRNSENLRKAVKRRLPALKRHVALAYEKLVVVEYHDSRGSASAVKIYNPDAPTDVQAMNRMIKDMRTRNDGMLSYYEKVTGLSGIEPDNGA